MHRNRWSTSIGITGRHAPEYAIKPSWYWIITIIPSVLAIIGVIRDNLPENQQREFMMQIYNSIPSWAWFIIAGFSFVITILISTYNYVKKQREKIQSSVIITHMETQSGGIKAEKFIARDVYEGGTHYHGNNDKDTNFRRVAPNIVIDKWFPGNRAYITIQNNETVALENTSVKIIDFRFNDSPNVVEDFSITKGFSVGLIEIGRKIIPNSPVIKVLIAQGIDIKFTEFFTDDDQHKHFQDLLENEILSWNNYRMTFQVFGQLTDEKENRLLGTYKGLLVHTNHFSQKENQIIIDNLTWKSFGKI